MHNLCPTVIATKISFSDEKISNIKDDNYNSDCQLFNPLDHAMLCTYLVTTRGLLASSQLLQVEVTHLHVAVVLLQTSGEGSGVSITGSTLLLVVVLLLSSQVLLRSLSWGRRATKHGGDSSTQSVTNGRANSDTSSGGSHLAEETWALRLVTLRLGNGSW